jgi:hypothetical protein
MNMLNLKELNEVECKEQYRVEISNRLAALENLDDNVDINRVWETVTENIKFQPKGVQVIANLRSISHSSTKDTDNYYIKGNKPNCIGCRIRAK